MKFDVPALVQPSLTSPATFDVSPHVANDGRPAGFGECNDSQDFMELKEHLKICFDSISIKHATYKQRA